MGRRRCCCVGGNCKIFQDFFTRDDDTDIGPDWIENGDNAAIDTYRLEVSNDEVMCNEVLSDPQGSFCCSVVLDDSQQGDDYEVWFYWKSITEVAIKARFEAPGTASGYWRTGIWSLSTGWYWDDVELIAGCGTSQIPFLENTQTTVYMSYDRIAMRILVAPTPAFHHYELWKCIPPPTEPAVTRMSLVHGGGSGNVYFDTVWWSEHAVYQDDCPWWGCYCGAGET